MTSSADFCFKIIFFRKNLSAIHCTIRVSNSLDSDQAPHFVGHDLCSNCLQKLSADDTSKLKLKSRKGELFATNEGEGEDKGEEEREGEGLQPLATITLVHYH